MELNDDELDGYDIEENDLEKFKFKHIKRTLDVIHKGTKIVNQIDKIRNRNQRYPHYPYNPRY